VARTADPKKRRAILAAATRLFAELGPSRVSVDEVARAAGVAKGTVYLYWQGKDALFEAVAESVAEDFLARAERALAAPGRPFEARLFDLLAAKYDTLYALVYRSPHAVELVEARNRVAAHVFERADRTYARRLARLLASSDGLADLGIRAPALAQLLMSTASVRAAGTGLTPGAHTRRLRAIARLTAAALRER
jgi:AcrR family transcriptional regulator